MQIKDKRTERFDIGKCVMLAYMPEYGEGLADDGSWDGTEPLWDHMVHLGTTEGAVEIESNEVYSDLTIEDTGPAILKRYLSGESPTFEVGVYPDHEKLAIFSPTGTASSGFMGQVIPRALTIALLPEQLFKTYVNGVSQDAVITFSGGAFLKDAQSLTPQEEELAGLGVVMWRVQFTRLTVRYAHEDAGKSLRSVTGQVLQDTTKQNGCQLILSLAEMARFTEINFEGGS